jgi:hypothetical protein
MIAKKEHCGTKKKEKKIEEVRRNKREIKLNEIQ